MAKFKKGDRVRNIQPDDFNPYLEYYKFSETGVVDEDDNIPFVIWDRTGKRTCQNEKYLELITGEQDAPKTADVQMGPTPGTEEWWRWHFAGQAMQGVYATMGEDYHTMQEVIKQVSKISVMAADALIAELKGGKP